MPSRDEIHLPPRSNFDAPDKYYATALHELGHWSGHESRLQREFGPKGSVQYAKEELRAEIASWMLGQDIGIGHDPGQHAAYVKSWIQALKEDPLEIMRACRDAEQIKEYVLGLDREHVIENINEVESDKGRRSLIVGAVAMGAPEMPAPLEPAAAKTWLHVPYRERYEVKALGARWDKTEKSWYAPPGTDLAPLARWLPTPELDHQPVQPHMDPVQEFSEQLQALGLDLQGKAPLMDGRLHRVPLLEKQGRGLDGAYRIYGDGQPAGWAQNFVTGEQIKLRATGVRLTPEEQARQRAQIEAQRQEREQALQARHNEVAREAQRIWNDTPRLPSSEHPYLKAKGIEGTDIREDRNGNLLIPLYRPDSGELRGLQYIAPDGKKSFMPGMEKQGNCHVIMPSANVSPDKASILICEGYATGVSLSMAAPDRMVVVAFDAGNLRPVSRAVRGLYPEADITLCADNDHDKIRNTGVQKAEIASFLAGIKLKVPSFTEAEMAQGLTDFNDIHQARGLEAVRENLGLSLQKGVER